MFPDPENPPAGPPQGAVHQSVAGFVAGEFPMPERPVVCWLGAVFGAGMPETAVHEHCEPRLPENKIRPHAKSSLRAGTGRREEADLNFMSSPA